MHSYHTWTPTETADTAVVAIYNWVNSCKHVARLRISVTHLARLCSPSTTMSSKVVPTMQVTSVDTDDASTRQQPDPRSSASGGRRSLREENSATPSIPGGGGGATVRLEEPSHSETEDKTAVATMAAISGLGLGMGFGLESGGASTRTPGPTPTRRGVRVEDALSTSRDIQQPQLGGAGDAAGSGTAGERRNDHDARDDVVAADTRPERAGNPPTTSGSEVTTWKTNAKTGGEEDGSEGRKGTGTHLHLKTLAHLPGVMGREHIASYAEEHAADVSAEINSLSKVRRWTRLGRIQ